MPRRLPLDASAAALFVDAECRLNLSAPEEPERVAHPRIHLDRSDVRVIGVDVEMLVVVVDLQPVRPLRAESVEVAARIRIGGIDGDRAQVVRQRERVVIRRVVQPALRSEDGRPVRGERFGAIERVGRILQVPYRHQGLPQPHQRIHVLRLHGDDRTIDVDRSFRMPHPRMQAGNPQSRLDIVGIRGGDSLELLQRCGIGA